MKTVDAIEDAVPERLARLIDIYGNNVLAKMLGVSRSQPSRWRSGKEAPGLDRRQLILHLDYVTNRLLEIFHRRVASIWLESHNAVLGTRPIDVLRLRGPLALEAAIAYEEQQAIG
jgi:transcriptional regulator with XRE-family HTH domain